MAQVLSVSGTIFIIIALGWGLTRRGIFDARALDALGGYVITCALPALIFRATSARPVSDTFDAAYLLALTGASLGLFFLGYQALRRLFGCNPTAATFGAMGMTCANSGFVGYPMMQLALPERAEHALALNMTFDNLLMIPLVLALAEAERARAAPGATPRIVPLIARRLAASPVILALAAGLTVAATGIDLPQIVTGPVEILAGSSAAVSLLVIGGALASLKLSSLGPLPWVITLAKLVVMPALAWAALALLAAAGLTPTPGLAPALILMMAIPAMTIYPVLARRYGEETTAAAAMMLQTLASFVTISVVLALLGLPGE